MASQRLIKYAALVNEGENAFQAAVKAGYAKSTAKDATTRLTPQAIEAGLLPDPEKRAELVEQFEKILADGLLEMAEALVAKGKRGDLVAIREAFDRYLGKVRQTVDMSATVDADQTITYKMKWPEDIGDEDG